MTLKVGKSCKFDDIKVGEVFAVKGCWIIYYKIREYDAMLLAEDFSRYDFSGPFERYILFQSTTSVYKLPKSVQSLWKCD
jgi:hypothetical protein